MLTTPRTIITADLCVIEEQDDHLVFAVRVPRKTIESNQAFLSYLSMEVDGELSDD